MPAHSLAITITAAGYVIQLSDADGETLATCKEELGEFMSDLTPRFRLFKLVEEEMETYFSYLLTGHCRQLARALRKANEKTEPRP